MTEKSDETDGNGCCMVEKFHRNKWKLVKWLIFLSLSSENRLINSLCERGEEAKCKFPLCDDNYIE